MTYNNLTHLLRGFMGSFGISNTYYVIVILWAGPWLERPAIALVKMSQVVAVLVLFGDMVGCKKSISKKVVYKFPLGFFVKMNQFFPKNSKINEWLSQRFKYNDSYRHG